LLELVQGSQAELWYIDDEVTDSARHEARKYVFSRAATLDELQNIEKIDDPDLARTAVAQAVNQNHAAVITGLAALTVIVDERIEVLPARRPNSEAKQQDWQEEVAELQNIRHRISDLRLAVVGFRTKRGSEAALNSAAISFWDSVKNWYKKNYQRILTQAADVSILLASTSIMSMLGVHPTDAAYISAVLVGGKTVATALRSIAKGLLQRDK
jgi:hypothetical protein